MPPPETPPETTLPRSPPPNSTLVLKELPTGLTVRVPPLGYPQRTSVLLWIWSIAWSAFAILLSATLIGRQGLFSATAFFVLFGSVGAIPLVMGIHFAKRQAAIAMVDDRLMIMQVGLLGSKRHEWALADIDTIEVGRSNFLINRRPVPQLQIRSRHGELFGMLTGHHPEELQWLADTLSQRLEPADEAAPEEQAAP